MDNKKSDQNTEQRILEAAMQIFVRDGLQGARMQDIADLANINRAMLHYYFRDKASLSHKVIEQTILKFHSSLHEILDIDIPFEEKMDRYIQHQIELYFNNSDLVIFALHESLRNKDIFKEIFKNKHLHQKFINQLNEEIKKGHIKPFTIEEFVISIVSLCAFPACAGSIFKMIFNWDDEKWETYRTQLKQSLPGVVKQSVYTNYNSK